MDESVPRIREDVVDGITTFWVETPPPLTAVLAFRVGVWDEQVLERGITHLMEHLALYALRGAELPFNGEVGGPIMLVLASGSEEEVRGFLGDFCRQLRDLPVDRLETEAGVLRAEAERRPATYHDRLLGILFGPNGPGVQCEPERALEVASGTDVQAWADRYCVRENAVLLLDGPPPTTLGMDLPSGEYAPFVLPGDDVGYRPGRLEIVGCQSAGICLGALCRRSTDLVMGLEILQHRLTDRLRHELGLAYAVEPAYQPLDDDTAYVYAGVDAPEQRLEEAAKAFLDVIRDLRGMTPSQEEVARSVRTGFNAAQQDAATVARGELQRVAWARLTNHTSYSWADLMAEREAATQRSIHDAWCRATHRGLLVTPEIQGLGLPHRKKRTSRPVDGIRFKPSWGARGEISMLVVGADGVSSFAEDRWITLRWDDLVLAEQAAPNEWALWSRTGAWTTLASKEWRRSRKLAKLLEASIPEGVRWPRSRRGRGG